MSNDLHKQMVFEANRKSTGVAYLLWLFLGWFGVHRFYTGRIKSGVAMLILALTGVGLAVGIPWWLIDVVLVPGMVREKNVETMQLLGAGSPSAASQRHSGEPQPARRVRNEADRRREEMLEDLRQTGYKKERRDRNPLLR